MCNEIAPADSLAASHLKEGGMVILPGAAPAVSGTPGMAGYGMAKVSPVIVVALRSDECVNVISEGCCASLDQEPGLPWVRAP